MPSHCPKPGCRYFEKATGRFYVKKGYYVTRYNHQPVPRYRCKGCGGWFSSHTFRPTYRQKKPHLNQAIFRLYCSAVTQRRIARVLGVNRKTVVRKFQFLAAQARQVHDRRLDNLACAQLQFDEMETFEHTRLKPISIALGVTGEGKIVGVKAAPMPYKGTLAEIARRKYGYREDKREEAREAVLVQAARLSPWEIVTDAQPAYRRAVRRHLPRVRHVSVTAHRCHPVRRLAERRRNQCDPLFAANHTAAKIRHDLSRMARRVWTTTKKLSRLQDHLDLYTAYLNDYPL